MTEEFGDLVEAPAGIGEVAPEGVSQLVRCHCGRQSGSSRGGPQQLVDRVRPQRCPERLARNRFTTKKSLSAAPGWSSRSRA